MRRVGVSTELVLGYDGRELGKMRIEIVEDWSRCPVCVVRAGRKTAPWARARCVAVCVCCPRAEGWRDRIESPAMAARGQSGVGAECVCGGSEGDEVGGVQESRYRESRCVR